MILVGGLKLGVSALGSMVSGFGRGMTNPAESLAAGGVKSVAGFSLNWISSWVLHGTEAALQYLAQLIGQTTSPELESAWFSGTYLRVVGLATLLTLPFLFAAAVQAVVRTDLTLLTRAAFAYLPIALLGVSIAAPLTMLLLSATDEMCSIVSAAGTGGGAQLLDNAAAYAAGVSSLKGSPFFAVVVGLITLAAALAVTLELLIRQAAVYVVVLMLPLAFAAFVWPARRIWAIRMVELLISLIVAKFVIVAVLSLAGAAFGQGHADALLTAMTLLLLATFAPWVLLRLLPFTEVAAGAGGALRAGLPDMGAMVNDASAQAMGVTTRAGEAIDLARGLPRALQRGSGDGAGGRRGDGTDEGSTGFPGPEASAVSVGDAGIGETTTGIDQGSSETGSTSTPIASDDSGAVTATNGTRGSSETQLDRSGEDPGGTPSDSSSRTSNWVLTDFSTARSGRKPAGTSNHPAGEPSEPLTHGPAGPPVDSHTASDRPVASESDPPGQFGNDDSRLAKLGPAGLELVSESETNPAGHTPSAGSESQAGPVRPREDDTRKEADE